MLTTLLFLSMTTARAAWTIPPKQILHLSITCEDGAPNRSQAVVGRALRRHNKGADVHLVEMKWPCGGEETQIRAAVDELVGRLDRLVTTEVSVFDLIALDFPDLGSNQPTYVAPLGHVTPNGMDDELKTALLPLYGRAKINGKILMMAGNSLTGDQAWNEGRVDHILDFFGATKGTLFGLEKPKAFVEPFSWKKDIRLATLVTGVATAFTAALWIQPEFTWKAIGASILYGVGFKILHDVIGGTPDDKPKVDPKTPPTLESNEQYFESQTALKTINMVMPRMLGNVVAAVQFLGTTGNVGPAVLKSFAIQAGILVPAFYLAYPAMRRLMWAIRESTGQINVGRQFKRQSDGTYDGSVKKLYDHARQIFGCEPELTESTTPVDAPVGESAA